VILTVVESPAKTTELEKTTAMTRMSQTCVLMPADLPI
jgi:hypothetical protein